MIAGLKEAKLVEDTIKRLGIQDVKLFWDRQLGMWGVYQVRRQASHFILPSEHETYEHLLLWWCKDKEGKYRPPNEEDIRNVVATVHRAQVAFQKGGDWLADQLDAQDKEREEKADANLHDKIHDISKDLKKAVKRELG